MGTKYCENCQNIDMHQQTVSLEGEGGGDRFNLSITIVSNDTKQNETENSLT